MSDDTRARERRQRLALLAFYGGDLDRAIASWAQYVAERASAAPVDAGRRRQGAKSATPQRVNDE